MYVLCKIAGRTVCLYASFRMARCVSREPRGGIISYKHPTPEVRNYFTFAESVRFSWAAFRDRQYRGLKRGVVRKP